MDENLCANQMGDEPGEPLQGEQEWVKMHWYSISLQVEVHPGMERKVEESGGILENRNFCQKRHIIEALLVESWIEMLYTVLNF